MERQIRYVDEMDFKSRGTTVRSPESTCESRLSRAEQDGQECSCLPQIPAHKFVSWMFSACVNCA